MAGWLSFPGAFRGSEPHEKFAQDVNSRAASPASSPPTTEPAPAGDGDNLPVVTHYHGVHQPRLLSRYIGDLGWSVGIQETPDDGRAVSVVIAPGVSALSYCQASLLHGPILAQIRCVVWHLGMCACLLV